MHGTSADLNAGHLPSIHAWADFARDLLNFLQHCMPEDGENPGWALEWCATRPIRPVISVGHSFGGNASVQAAAAAPNLFEGLFLVEPMVNISLPPAMLTSDESLGRQQRPQAELPRPGDHA